MEANDADSDGIPAHDIPRDKDKPYKWRHICSNWSDTLGRKIYEQKSTEIAIVMFPSLWIYIQIILIYYPHGGDTIYYGERAKFKRFEHMVCLYAFSGNGSALCGGVIIDEFHILTAAHCLSDFEPEDIIVTAGKPRRNDIFSPSWGVERIHSHPNFEANNKIPRTIYRILKSLSCITKKSTACLLPKHDIAVLKLVRALPLGERMTRVELPKSDSLPHCQELEYAGWGHTEDGVPPDYLQSTHLIVLHPEECLNHDVLHRQSQFCAITADRKSLIADGDSGNPLVNMNIVYGITSFVPGKSPSMFVVFTKVFNYIDFINDIIKSGNETGR